MKHFWIICLICLSCQEKKTLSVWEKSDVVVYEKFDDIEPLFQIDSDTTYLINFWATWCKPCVEELPYIEALNGEYSDKKFKNILLSLDNKKHIDSKLIPFLNKNEIESNVVLLADGKFNDWIDRVDNRWSGAIPITYIYNKKHRLFFEQSFESAQELIDIINPIIE